MFKYNLYVYYMFNGLLYMIFFFRMRVLCIKFNDCFVEVFRSFDKDRDGFVMLEGAGILILEEMFYVINRGVFIYVEVLGYGLLGDVYYMIVLRVDGQGVYRCMMVVIKDVGVNLEDIGYINVYVIFIFLGDRVES